jgi:NitT/TauT family transport system substrate-binding protein
MKRRLSRTRRPLWFAVATLAAASLLALTACSSSGSSDASPTGGATTPAADLTTLRLGFFPNLTHAPAFVALQEGYLKDSLGASGVKVAPTLFNAGPEAVTALFANSIDIAYLGPNPTVSAWTQSKGDAITVISGAASGGASFVVTKDISSAADLAGKKVASPQLGNTQDVALKYWLNQQGQKVAADGTGPVTVINASNSDIVTAFTNGDIVGAWVPEPYAQQLVADGGKVLVNEKTLWPGGKFVTTNIAVRTQFLNEHPDVVKEFLTANEAALAFIKKDPKQAQADFNAGLLALTGGTIDTAILPAAWDEIDFTDDPLKTTLVESADHAVSVGLLDQSAIDAAGGFDPLYDLTLLNEVRGKAGLPPVKL